MKSRITPLLGLVACAALAPSAHAGSVDLAFVRITESSAPDISNQLRLTVASVVGQPGRIDFTLQNIVGIASSVTDVYFSAGDMLGQVTMFQTGSLFVAARGNLPGTTEGFESTRTFRTAVGLIHDDGSAANPAGLDRAGDSVTFRFELRNGASPDDVIGALVLGASNDVRIGLVARAIDNSPRNDSFVNSPLIVPIPAAAWAGMAGLGAVAGFAWMRRRAHQRD